jgi:hypothetical protein
VGFQYVEPRRAGVATIRASKVAVRLQNHPQILNSNLDGIEKTRKRQGRQRDKIGISHSNSNQLLR